MKHLCTCSFHSYQGNGHGEWLPKDDFDTFYSYQKKEILRKKKCKRADQFEENAKKNQKLQYQADDQLRLDSEEEHKKLTDDL